MNPFPPDFLWGAATAAYQVEGAVDVDGRSPSIWDTFSHTPGKTFAGHTGDVACDHYHRYVEDVDVMRKLGLDAYRFSLSWSRLLPSGTGEANPAGVAFYRRLLEALRSAGITPLVTLYHWDLPQVLEERGGWLNPDSVDWFVEYATVAKRELGDLAHIWATFNEPWCTAFLGYSAGEHAPGHTDPGSGFVAAHHLMLAHHRAVESMRATRPHEDDQLGIVLNLIPAWPADPDDLDDVAAAWAVDGNQNRLFLDAVFAGRIPSDIRSAHERYGVADRIDPEALATVVAPIDFLGVNYYNINRAERVVGAPAPGPWPAADETRLTRPPGELNEMDWASEPEGLTWMLERISNEYPHVPVVICENGVAYADQPDEEGFVDDQDRIEYLDSHLAAVADAIGRGVDVRGYMAWSLMDNFEWARGYSKLFGLVRVDPQTQDRTVKASGYWYADFIARART